MSLKRALCAILTLALLLASGCSSGSPKSPDPGPTEPTEPAEPEPEPTPLELAVEEALTQYEALAKTELTPEEQELLALRVRLPEEAAEAMESAAASHPSDYPYGDLFEIERAYDLYEEKVTPYDGEILPILSGGSVDAQELYALVRANNEAYLNDTDTSPVYFALEDEVVEEACEIIAQTVNGEIKNPAMTINLDDLSENLTRLRIITGLSWDNAYVNGDGVMGMNPQFMKTMNYISGEDDAYNECISHETIHLFQKRSQTAYDRGEFEEAFGPAYMFEELEVDSLYNSWFTEAAAETLACRIYGIAPVTYATKIGYANSLFLVNGLREDFDSYEAPRICVEHDLDRFLSFFGCETREEKLELLTVMYSIDIMQEEPDDFLGAYAAALGTKQEDLTDEQMDELKWSLKPGICEYLTREFYKNLARRLTESSATLEELFTMLAIFECDLNNHLVDFTRPERDLLLDGFFDMYPELQTAFFDQVSAVCGVPPEDLSEAFYTFNGRLERQEDNQFMEINWKIIDIPWLTPNQLKLVQQVYQDTIYMKTLSIAEFASLRQQIPHATA